MKINRNHIWTSGTTEAAQVLKKAEVKTTTHTETTEELKATQTKGDSCDASLLSATATDDRAPRIPSTGRTRAKGELFK